MRIAVLGAGLLGVTSAYYLAKDGHQVVVIDRQNEPASETSHATASLLTPGHTVAWAGPSAPWQLLSSYWDANSALKFRFKPSVQLARWCWRFLRQCTAERYRYNTSVKHRLAKYSVDLINEASREHDLKWDQIARGVLYLERDASKIAKSRAALAAMADAGVEIETLDRDQILAIEPALRHAKIPLAGALRIAIDQVGDGRKFALGLADVCKRMAVDFRYGVSIKSLAGGTGKIAYVETDQGRIEADAFVLALGSYSPLLAQNVGIQLPIYPVKGYSVTMPVLDPDRAPRTGAVEEVSHVTFARLGDRVRMTTRAEFAGYDNGNSPADFAKILHIAHALFDGGVDIGKAFFWSCLRPATSDGPPILGPTPISNLWLNAGHGYLGWTMSCGSSKMLSDLVAGRTPDIDHRPYLFARF